MLGLVNNKKKKKTLESRSQQHDPINHDTDMYQKQKNRFDIRPEKPK